MPWLAPVTIATDFDMGCLLDSDMQDEELAYG